MQIRKEYKYLVHRDNLEKLRNRLLPFVELDKYVKNGNGYDYKVRSIYFDTGKMNYYCEKDAGIERRKKFRIRGYEDTSEDSVVFLEVKRKKNEIVWKNRAPIKFKNIYGLFISKDTANLVLNHVKYPKAVNDADAFLYYFHKEFLVPVILIVYNREPFFSKFNSDLRITFDKNIRSKICSTVNGLFNEHKEIYAINDYFVLEIKFNFGFPRWLDKIVREFGLIREAVSKYTICIDNHRPEIEKLFRHSSVEFFTQTFNNTKIFDEVLAKYD